MTSIVVEPKDMEYLPNNEEMRLTGSGTLRILPSRTIKVSGSFDVVDIDFSRHTQERLLDLLMKRMRLTYTGNRTVSKIKKKRPTTGPSSYYIGVHHTSRGAHDKRWVAQIKRQGVRKIKTCATEIEAARQYNAWMDEHGLRGPRNIIEE